MDAICEVPFSEAVTVTVCALEIEPAVIVKLVLVAAGPTVTDVGMLSKVLLLDSPTIPPPLWESVTVQVPDWPALRLAGVQVSVLTEICTESVIDAVCEVPFSEAVTVTVCPLEIEPAAAVKVAVVAEALTVTDAGTLREALLLESATVPPPVCDRVTMQVLDWSAPRLAGVQVSVLTDSGAESVTEAVREVPFSEAVTVTVCPLEMEPAVAVKVAVVAEAPTVTEAGRLRAALLLVSATVPPPVCDSVTVQVLDCPALRLAGVQARALTTDNVAESVIGAIREVPFTEAVTMAVCALETDPAVTVKLAVVADGPTVTDAGTLREAVLLDSPTIPPPVWVSVTVHVPDWPALRLAGVQVNVLTDSGMERVIEAICEMPFSEAVTLAIWPLEMVPAVAVNVALVADAPTVTEAGTLSDALLLDSPTVPPPV